MWWVCTATAFKSYFCCLPSTLIMDHGSSNNLFTDYPQIPSSVAVIAGLPYLLSPILLLRLINSLVSREPCNAICTAALHATPLPVSQQHFPTVCELQDANAQFSSFTQNAILRFWAATQRSCRRSPPPRRPATRRTI